MTKSKAKERQYSTTLQNKEAERSVLGAALNGLLEIDDLANKFSPEAFTDQEYQKIYQIILDLHSKNKKPDLVTISDYYSNYDLLSNISSCVFSGSIHDHVNIVQDLYLRRTIQQKCLQAYELIQNKAQNAISIVDQVQHSFTNFAIGNENNCENISPILHRIFDSLEQGTDQTGYQTGFTDLDTILGGFYPTNLTILAARPGMGKTALAGNLIINLTLNGNACGFFSLEMNKDQIVKRMIAQLGKIEFYKIKRNQLTDEDWKTAYHTADLLTHLNIYIDDTPRLTIYDIRSRARKMVQKYGIKVLLIDYLTKIKPSRNRETRDQEVTDIAADLKALARELNIPVICLAQLNRKCEERQNKRPILADLRESGGIEQEADDIIFIYRDEVYNKTSKNQGKAELLIRKQRNGSIGSCDLAFIEKYVSFEELCNI